MIESTTDYKNLPRLTTGDEDFRNTFISWDLGDLTFIDIQEYLKVKDVVLVPMAASSNMARIFHFIQTHSRL